jgi:hypothetical protein
MVLVRLDEVAYRCKLSKRNVYEWVKKGILVPVQRDRSVTGGLVFNETDVSSIEKLLNENITVFTAAKKLGVPYQFMTKWLEANGIAMEEEYIGSKTKHFLKVKWLEENQHKIVSAYDVAKGKKRKRVGSGIELMLHENGVRLFQRLKRDGEQLLVVNTNPIIVRNKYGIVDVGIDLIRVSETWNDAPYSGYKGNIICRVPKSLAIDDEAFTAVHLLISYVGTKNIRIFDEEDFYVVVCRSGYIPLDPVITVFLELYLVDGVYFEEEERLVLGDIEMRLNIGVPYSVLKKLQEAAGIDNVSVQAFISELASKWATPIKE